MSIHRRFDVVVNKYGRHFLKLKDPNKAVELEVKALDAYKRARFFNLEKLRKQEGGDNR